MTDSPRLIALRFLERVQLQDLERTRRWIAEEEGRAAEEAARRPPPAPPEWLVERGIDGARSPIAIHVGDCKMRGRAVQPLTRDQAVTGLVEHGIRPCPLCRPDTALGVL
ncbi:DUF6233 domain-containing protein [Streptomyces sp. NRRL F-5135]|uniref:DUF6233 domain-containing protein n=1 Tax=Streptomyces sp. NRRL F-5135 TaxID=1463858 RepID=UPI0004CA4CD3|nr:DUF6233 domain-containing protein [Streptomyces sp. NRRL F-5135]